MKNGSFLFLILTLTACTQEVEMLKTENLRLKKVNNSLLTELQINRGVPFIPSNFVGELSKAHKVHFLAVRKGGYALDSLAIEGYSKEQAKQLCDIESDKFGGLLKFTPDTPGAYHFRTYTRLKDDGHTVI